MRPPNRPRKTSAAPACVEARAGEQLGVVNLNLLRTLSAIVESRGTARAAERLGITESAVFHALRKLRALFKDPLVVRGRHGLIPTARAEQVAAPLLRGFAEIERAAAEESGFDPATAVRSFTLTAGDHMAAVVLQGLVMRGLLAAPRVTLRVSAADAVQRAADLEGGRVHAAIAVDVKAVEKGLRRRVLFEDDFACVVANDHPEIRKRVSVKQLERYPHLVVSRENPIFRQVDEVLRGRGIERRIALELPYFLVAPSRLPGTDMVLIAPRTLGTLFALGYPLRVLNLPFTMPTMRESLYWHDCFDSDPAHRWFREQIFECVSTFRTRIRHLSESLVGTWPEALSGNNS